MDGWTNGRMIDEETEYEVTIHLTYIRGDLYYLLDSLMDDLEYCSFHPLEHKHTKYYAI